MSEVKRRKPQPKKAKKGRFEFSKKLVIWTNIAFWMQVFATMILISVNRETSEPMVAILATTATLAGAVHVGYFGKAGVENYHKISVQNADDDNNNDMEVAG